MAKKVEFLPSILWVFLTIYICCAFMKITMGFNHLEASHILLDGLGPVENTPSTK